MSRTTDLSFGTFLFSALVKQPILSASASPLNCSAKFSASDMFFMRRCFGCSTFGNPAFAVLSRAAAKSASARLRNLGVLKVSNDWRRRLNTCAGCDLYTVVNRVPHCGKPLLRQILRSPDQGCGCPVEAKARRTAEHCPISATKTPRQQSGACDCKWCSVA
jgi:hypothetical protein